MSIAVGSLAGTITGITGLFGGENKDPERLAANALALNLAVSGNPAALEYLRGRTGTVPGGVRLSASLPIKDASKGATINGWATALAKKDAIQKVAQVLAAANGGGGGAANAVESSPLSDAADAASKAAGGIPSSVLVVGALVLGFLAFRAFSGK